MNRPPQTVPYLRLVTQHTLDTALAFAADRVSCATYLKMSIPRLAHAADLSGHCLVIGAFFPSQTLQPAVSKPIPGLLEITIHSIPCPPDDPIQVLGIYPGTRVH